MAQSVPSSIDVNQDAAAVKADIAKMHSDAVAAAGPERDACQPYELAVGCGFVLVSVEFSSS